MRIKFTTLVLLALAIQAFISCSPRELELHVGSYNIRCISSSDAKANNHWDARKDYLCDVIDYEDFDVFGAQEVTFPQLNYMLENLDDYAYVGVGRTDGKEKGEFSPVFYKKDRIELLESSTFWISETPDEAGSVGWDAALPRVCSWGLFKDLKSGRKFYFFNLHMDHVGMKARVEGAKLVVAKIKEICKGYPVILTGDFNVDQNSYVYDTFVDSGVLFDSYELADDKLAFNGTFNSFKPAFRTESRIDHIFVTEGADVDKYGILTYSYWIQPQEIGDALKAGAAPQEIDFRIYDQKLPSDHYPLSVRLTFE